MGQESPGGVPEQLVVRDNGETDEDTRRKADIKGEDVDVVCGAPALVISGFELQGFIFSEAVRTIGLEELTLSEVVFDTARPPHYEFSNLQNIPLPFYLEILCWPVVELY